MDPDHDVTQAEQLDTPGGETPHEVKRSWTLVLASDANQVGVGLATMAATYAGKQVWDKIRKPPPPPPPPPSNAEGKS